MPAEARSDTFELIVLSLLESGPKYGYALSKEASSRTEGKVRLTPGVLYPLLQELESAGLITGSWDEVRQDDREEGSGRKRKWYRLSAKGRKRLEKQVAAHKAYTALINGFLRRSGQEEPA